MKETTMRAQMGHWGHGVEFLLFQGASVATACTFETFDDGAYLRPSFVLDRKAVQGLFNDLWAAGFRPADGTGDAGQLGATERHLEDMRKIAFSKLKIGG